MKHSQRQKFITTCVLSTVFISQAALSMEAMQPLFLAAEWTPRLVGLGGAGIGGLQSDIRSKFTLNPTDLDYRNGELLATIGGKQQAVQVSPVILIEAIDLVQHTDEQVFQVSIDTTHSGGVPYIDRNLTSVIGESLFNADLQFASLVGGGQSLPSGGGPHPYDEAIKLVEYHDGYGKLPEKWTQPPLSYPQIFLEFDHTVLGLVSMKFQPQVFLTSLSGYPLEASESEQERGELPYERLREDVKTRSDAYRQALPALDRAASITATLGLVAAGCQQPRSCDHLMRQAFIESGLGATKGNEPITEEQFKAKMEELWKRELALLIEERRNWPREEYPLNLKRLEIKWDERRFQNFQPANSPEAWGTAYNALQYILNPSQYNALQDLLNPSGTKEPGSEHEELLKQQVLNIIKAMSITQQQFLSQSVSSDPLLQAAYAYVVWFNKPELENLAKAKENLDLALAGSVNNPGTQIEVANMGTWMGVLMSNLGRMKIKEGELNGNKSLVTEGQTLLQEGKSIINKMNQELTEAQVKAYNRVDLYLAGCMEKPSNCSSEDLRIWEADIARMNAMFSEARWLVCRLESKCSQELQDLNPQDAREFLVFILYQDVPEEVVDWLHGRFAYLVGLQEPQWRADRLRFLEYYAQKLEGTKNGQELAMLAKDLRSKISQEVKN